MPRPFGYMPIMVQSSLCHLRGCSRNELVSYKEDPDEFGGTFICNGIERIIRLLIQQRRHYIMALRRSAYKKRGSNYTENATLIRCFATTPVRHRRSHISGRCFFVPVHLRNWLASIQVRGTTLCGVCIPIVSSKCIPAGH